MTVRRVIRRHSQLLSKVILLLETTKQVITIDTNLPIVHPRTIKGRQEKKGYLSQCLFQNINTHCLVSIVSKYAYKIHVQTMAILFYLSIS